MFFGRNRSQSVTLSNYNFRAKKFLNKRGLCDTCTFVDDGYKPAKFEYPEDQDWLKAKHRILLYPSSNEDKFLQRKMKNPVPRASGPRDDKDDDDFHMNFDWKGKRGSFGIFETTNLSGGRESVHPLRLLYPKTQENWMPNSTRNSQANIWIHNGDYSAYPHARRARASSGFMVNSKSMDYKPAKYDLEDDENDWLTSKHRILVYPSSSEEAFLRRKMTNPVPKAFGPRDVDVKKLPLDKRSYEWKGRRGSVGDYETNDVDKQNFYPLRLIYRKTSATSTEEVSNDNHSGEYFEGKDLGSKWRRYKCEEKEGQFGEYETVNYAPNGDIYPLRLWYSKSSENYVSADDGEESETDNPKLEKRCYEWKGKRGSIGDFETLAPSSSMSSIFPIRMLYPKPSSKLANSSSKTRSFNDMNNSQESEVTWNGSDGRTSKLDERCDGWKGKAKRGSLGLFETMCSSTKPVRRLLTSRSKSWPRSDIGRIIKIIKKKKKASRSRSICSRIENNIENEDIETSSGTISPLPSFHKDDAMDSESNIPVIRLTSSEKDLGDKPLMMPPPNKLEIPELEKRSYNWKGRRGSIGEFETIDSSQPTPVSSIYPLRMLYPKSRPPVCNRTKSTANYLNKSKKVKEKELPCKSSAYDVTFKDMCNAACELQPGDRSSITSSHFTTATGWDEDDQTSAGKTGSLCSIGSVDTSKLSCNIWPEKKDGMVVWTTDVETVRLPQLPNPKPENKLKSKEQRKNRGVSMWPTEVKTVDIPKKEKRKYKKKYSRHQKAKSFGGWKPATYDIPNPIADIKSKGIFAPVGLYSSKRATTGSKSGSLTAKKPIRKKGNTRCIRDRFWKQKY